MKRLLLLLVLLPLAAFCQLNDNFSDGNFTDPTWTDSTNFQIVNISGNNELNSNPQGGTNPIFLSTPNTMMSGTEWRFLIDLHFSPSTNNLVRVYLVSENANFTLATNAYYIQIGQTGADYIKFFKTGSTTPLFTGTSAFSGNVKVRIKVTRDASGTWNIFADNIGGTNFNPEGPSFIDYSYTSTSFFGVYCKYTLSNTKNFYFDDFFIGAPSADTVRPKISTVMATSPTTVDVGFTKFVNDTTANLTGNYAVDNGVGSPSSAVKDATDKALVHLTFLQNFTPSKIYYITISGIHDIVGNTMITASIKFGLAEPPDSNDVVINESLSHPFANGEKYIELYNRSQKIIDLKDLELASFDTSSFTVNNQYVITTNTYILFPQDYVALTIDPANVKGFYYTPNPDNFVQIGSMPSGYNYDDGSVGLIATTDQNFIDYFIYTSNMYYPMLTSNAGVSFERLNPDRPSNDKTNWHSAASDVGYGTPAYRNSQYSIGEAVADPITVSPEIFSPDNDGNNDVLNINYKFDVPGYMASITIYDAAGRLVRNLEKKAYLGTSGSFSWDGITNENEKARIGIYVIYCEVFDLNGNVKHYKKTAVLASKL